MRATTGAEYCSQNKAHQLQSPDSLVWQETQTPHRRTLKCGCQKLPHGTIAESVVPLERQLCGHPGGGFLFRNEFGTSVIETRGKQYQLGNVSTSLMWDKSHEKTTICKIVLLD